MLTSSVSSTAAAVYLSVAGLGVALVLAACLGWNALTRR